MYINTYIRTSQKDKVENINICLYVYRCKHNEIGKLKKYLYIPHLAYESAPSTETTPSDDDDDVYLDRITQHKPKKIFHM
jgi:hypothetical protein